MAGREGWRARFAPELSDAAQSAAPNAATAFAIYSGLTLVLALCLGGGTRPGLLSDVMTQVAAIPLLLWAVWRLRSASPSHLPKFGLGLVALLILFPLVQLLPLWPQAALHGAGRALEQDVLTTVGGVPSSGPLTVAREATLLSLLSLLPPVALFLATLLLPARHRRWLALIVIGYGLASVLLGLLQLSQGPSSLLRFYAITNPDDAVGFFANRNHFAALLNCVLILTSAWLLFLASDAGATSSLAPWRQVLIIASFTLIVALLAGQAMTRSRAGVGIAIVATILSCAMFPGLSRPGKASATPLRLLLATIGLGVVIGVQYGAFRIVERLGADPLQDARKSFAQNTYEAIKAYLPFGSGLGTFTQIYPAFEGLNTVLMGAYVNRAHNDLVEYALETGVFAAILLGLATLYLLGRAAALWRPSRPVTLDLMLQRAAAGVLVLILLHSVFDYPLRTTTMLSLLAVAAALLLSRPKDEDVHVASKSHASDSEGHGRKGRSREASQEFAGATAPQATEVAQPARKAWGQDVAWPDAWKPKDRSNSD